MSAPEISIGQRAEMLVLSKTHGPFKLGLNEGIDLTPDIAQKHLLAIENLDPEKIYNVNNGGSGKLTVAEKNELALYALLQDLDPSLNSPTPTIVNDFRRLQDFNLLIRKKGDTTDVPFGGIFVSGCRVSGAPYPQPAGDMVKRDIPFRWLRMDDLRGMTIRYLRIRNSVAPIATPSIATAVEAAGTSPFLVGDIVYVRIATSQNSHASGSAAPLPTEPMTGGSAEIAVPISVAGNKVTITAPDPGATNSYAIYASLASGAETFYGWFDGGAGAMSFDINTRIEPTNPRPPINNTSGYFAAQNDAVFGAAGGFAVAVDLDVGGAGKAPVIPQTGLRYVAVLKNGVRQVEPRQGASKFGFDPTGQYFFITETPTVYDQWELILGQNP